MTVKIREEESGNYIAYFLNLRILVETNKIGATIIDCVFNKNHDLKTISDRITKEYQINNKKAKNDVRNFLEKLEREIKPSASNISHNTVLKSPIGAEISITNACNLRCKHCYTSHHLNEHMPFHKYQDIIDILCETNVCETSIVGGEPLCHPEIIRIIEHTASKNVVLNLITNGLLVNSELIELIQANKKIQLNISLDGMEHTHNTIRGNGTFTRLGKILSKLQKSNIKTEILCTLNYKNFHEHMEIIEYCNKFDMPCNFNIFKPTRPDNQYLTLSPEDYFETLISLYNIKDNKKYSVGIGNASICSFLANAPMQNECIANITGIVIDYKGNMVPCPVMQSAGYYQNNLPKITENYLNDWKNHPAFKQFKAGNLLECQARSYIFNGSPEKNDPYGINAFKKYMLTKK